MSSNDVLRTRSCRHAALAACAAVMLVVFAGCPPAQEQAANTGAQYERWGITRSPAPAKAETRLAGAYRLLYDREFEDALAAYRELAEEVPNSAEAHLGLSMALRYTGDVDAALVECGKALEFDPDAVATLCNYADLITPYRGTETEEPMSEQQRYQLAEEYFKKALESKHRLAAYARTGLWCNYMATGRLSEAREQIAELGRKHYFPPALMSLAYNMLIGLEKNAIIFTNGDNDTYPLYALQEAEGLRPDVSIVNLSLLNLKTVAALWRDSLGVPISLSDEELAVLEAKKNEDDGIVTPSDQLVADIVRQAPAAGRPVYFAATVASSSCEPYRDRLVLEGFVRRVAENAVSSDVDIDRLTRNVLERYRMDVHGAKEPWLENLSPVTRHITPLTYNHLYILDLVVDHYSAVGNHEQARMSLHDMYHSSEHSGLVDGMKEALKKWSRLYPSDPEGLELKRMFEEKYPAEVEKPKTS